MQESERSNPIDMAAISKVFDTVARLLEKDPSRSVPSKVPFTESGSVEVGFVSEVLNSQEALSLEDAQAGDVVWWRDAGGNTGFYLVTEPYTCEPDTDGLHKSGRGVVKVMTEKGEMVSRNTIISGASFGGSVRIHKITKNIPLEFIAGPDRQDPNSPFPWSRYFTTPRITAMGIIKAGDLQI